MMEFLCLLLLSREPSGSPRSRITLTAAAVLSMWTLSLTGVTDVHSSLSMYLLSCMFVCLCVFLSLFMLLTRDTYN